MMLEIKKNFLNKSNIIIYIFENPKELLNRYFFSDKTYIKIKLRNELLKAFPKFFFNILFNRFDFLKNYQQLPADNNLKQKIINFYSLLLLSRGVDKYSDSICIIGDCQNALNMSVLQLSLFVENIEFWIINQGSGSMKNKIDFKYPNSVRKVFFPYSNESVYENSLLLKANSNNKAINFYNIDTTLNLELSNKVNNLAIFQGYNKNYRLYPFYILVLIKELLLINCLKEVDNFDKVDIFLHPRLKFLYLLNYFNLKRSILFKVYDPRVKYKFNYVISYSPTINSSLRKTIKNNENYLYELGSNFNINNIQKCLKIFKLHK